MSALAALAGPFEGLEELIKGLVVLLFMYCAMRELIRAIGPHEVRRMFFGPGRSGSTNATRDDERARGRATRPRGQKGATHE